LRIVAFSNQCRNRSSFPFRINSAYTKSCVGQTEADAQ
jgi:hypothetical protein